MAMFKTRRHRISKRGIFGAVAILCLCSGAFGQHDSPFGGKQKAPNPTPVATQTPSRLSDLEFTGLFVVQGEVTFSLYDSKTKLSLWIPQNGTEDGFSISGFDDLDSKIVVTHGGQSREIAINENEIIALKQTVRPTAKPAVKKPVVQKDPETLKKEEEARTFVSDLLASSLARREESRRKREEQIANARRRAGRD